MASRPGSTLQTLFLAVLLFALDDSIVNFVFEEGFGQRAILGAVDLIDWADEHDLERAAIHILLSLVSLCLTLASCGQFLAMISQDDCAAL